jgi:type III restriction enzyme
MTYLYNVYKQAREAKELYTFKNAWNENTLWQKGLRYTPRPHQDEAIARLEHYETILRESHGERYLLFHMATGSGKTLVMASAILYYYTLGYRRFMFISEKTVLIDKTKDVLTNTESDKYLFAESVRYNGKRLRFHAVDTIQDSTESDIYICFKTIQTLQNELDENKVRENATHYEELKEAKTLYLVDEAHHFTDSKNDAEKRWKGILEGGHTIHQVGLLDVHPENRILGFSATLEEGNRHFDEAYGNRLLYNYAFKAYREAGYTKEPELLALSLPAIDRIMLACLNSLYRQYIAGQTYHLKDFVPKVLVKFPKTDLADAFHIEFETYLKQVSSEKLKALLASVPASLPIHHNLEELNQKFDLVSLLKSEFEPYSERVKVIHGSSSKKDETIAQLNQMDSKHTPLRLVFAVNMLNEGWDVLSLFDIVRYEESDSATSKVITADVQLIGRGARYYPFPLEKFEADKRKSTQGSLLSHIEGLENLTYFTDANNRYLHNLQKEALKSIGGLNEQKEPIKCVSTLKPAFKTSRVWKDALLVGNRFKPFEPLSLEELKTRLTTIIKPSQWAYRFGQNAQVFMLENAELKEGKLPPFSWNKQVQGHPQWRSRLLNTLFASMDEDSYFRGKSLFQKLTFQDREAFVSVCLDAMLPHMEWLNYEIPDDLDVVHQGLIRYFESHALPLVRKMIERNMGCSDLKAELLHKVIESKIPQGEIVEYLHPNESGDNTTPLRLTQEDDHFYVFDRYYGTTLEKDLIERIKGLVVDAHRQADEFYLVRNHHFLKLYGEDGRGFEPDFLLYTFKDNETDSQFHLIFLEPKNATLAEAEKWKEKLLMDVFHEKEYSFTESGIKHRLLALNFITEENISPKTEELKALLCV